MVALSITLFVGRLLWINESNVEWVDNNTNRISINTIPKSRPNIYD